MTDGEFIANVASGATIIGVALSFYLFYKLRRATIELLNAQLAVVRPWAVGNAPKHAGWSDDDVDTLTLFKWHHPRFAVMPLASAGLTHLSALDSLLVGRRMRRQLVALVQAIESFNSYQQKIEGFVTGGSTVAIAVATKLDTVFDGEQFKLSTGLFARDSVALSDVFRESGLTVDELRWAKYLAEMTSTLHITLIGNAEGKGMYRYLRELEAQMRREGLFEPEEVQGAPDAGKE